MPYFLTKITAFLVLVATGTTLALFSLCPMLNTPSMAMPAYGTAHLCDGAVFSQPFSVGGGSGCLNYHLGIFNQFKGMLPTTQELLTLFIAFLAAFFIWSFPRLHFETNTFAKWRHRFRAYQTSVRLQWEKDLRAWFTLIRNNTIAYSA